VAELADALRSGRSDRKVVEVRVLSRAPTLLFFPFSRSGGPRSREEVRNQRDDGKNQQQVNQEPRNVKEDEPAYPQNRQEQG
jgi:hypothetical protein